MQWLVRGVRCLVVVRYVNDTVGEEITRILEESVTFVHKADTDGSGMVDEAE